MAAGRQIEFVAVPRADDVALLAEAQPRALLVGRDDFLDLMENLALANRAAGMRANIFISQDLAAGTENADFESFQGENPVIPIGYIGQLSDRDLIHSAHLHI